jgi:hypothetical protein
MDPAEVITTAVVMGLNEAIVGMLTVVAIVTHSLAIKCKQLWHQPTSCRCAVVWSSHLPRTLHNVFQDTFVSPQYEALNMMLKQTDS